MTVDCLIAGAGPTGLTLALELVRRGKTVRIFDRSSGPRPENQSRALGILPPTLTILKPSGVTEKLLAEGLKIEVADVRLNDRPSFKLALKHAGGEYPFLLSLPQGRTERILIKALAKFGVTPEWNSSVTAVKDEEGRCEMVVRQDGKNLEFQGRYIAGCDGVRSVVREAVGIAFEGERFPTSFSLADVTLKNQPPRGIAVANATDDGIIAQLPLPNGDVRLIGSFPSVEKHPKNVPLIEKVGWVSDFEITFRHADKLRKGNVVIAGDAAHVHSPAGGRGMNTGIADAAWLAWLMYENRIEDYDSYRLPVAEKIIKQTRTLTNIAAGAGRLRRFMLRFVLPTAMKLPAVQRRAASQLLAYDMPHPKWIDQYD